MRITSGRAALTLAALTTVLAGLLAAPGTAATPAAPDPVTRAQLLTLADYEAVYPDMDEPLRITLRSPVFAPRGCEDQGQAVRGTSRIFGSVSAGSPRRSVALIDQNVIRFSSKARGTGPRPALPVLQQALRRQRPHRRRRGRRRPAQEPRVVPARAR